MKNYKLSINYHITESCNAHCEYCFATFPNVKKRNRLEVHEQNALIKLLVKNGAEKINFAGGEPTIEKNLGKLCKLIKKHSDGQCAVSIVSNGYRLSKLIDDWGEYIDWVAVSVDSDDDKINAKIGRTKKNKPYALPMLELAKEITRRGIELKCNIVVGQHNVDADLTNYLEKLSPNRLKLLQMLPVGGENDSAVEKYEISKQEFQAFVQRHESSLKETDIVIVSEDNDDMTNSYLMISPEGRFYWHELEEGERTIKYGDPILEVGFEEALKQVKFDNEKFNSRGGDYDYLKYSPQFGCTTNQSQEQNKRNQKSTVHVEFLAQEC